jgi:hypothetical protein
MGKQEMLKGYGEIPETKRPVLKTVLVSGI